jgi:hypothetical protein
MISATSNTRTSDSEVLHQLIERVHHGRPRFGGQVRVDLSCSRTAMPEVFLNDAQVHAHFQQMRCVRMSKTVNVSTFGDAGGIDGALERLLQTAVSERVDQRAGFGAAARCGK